MKNEIVWIVRRLHILAVFILLMLFLITLVNGAFLLSIMIMIAIFSLSFMEDRFEVMLKRGDLN